MPINLSKLKKDAYTLDAIMELGVPSDVARMLLADTSIPERPRLSLSGRKRAQPTTEYVWGPDAVQLLSGRG